MEMNKLVSIGIQRFAYSSSVIAFAHVFDFLQVVTGPYSPISVPAPIRSHESVSSVGSRVGAEAAQVKRSFMGVTQTDVVAAVRYPEPNIEDLPFYVRIVHWYGHHPSW